MAMGQTVETNQRLIASGFSLVIGIVLIALLSIFFNKNGE